MRECTGTPVWPCAMVGAASCLAGFSDVGVVIHGSSGCYYFADYAIPDPLYCTFLMEDEVVFGSEERLIEIVEGISQIYPNIAVVNTCVPSLMGEDIRDFLSGYNTFVIDAPGYTGQMEAGWHMALRTLDASVDAEREGVNIDGICSVDRFAPGNLMEIKRLLGMAGIPVAGIFSADTLESVRHASPVTVEACPALSSDIGTSAGSLLGIDNLRDTFGQLGNLFETADTDPVLDEIDRTEEVIIKECDRFLRRFDPPSAAVFSISSYAELVSELLRDYLDSEVVSIGCRDLPRSSAPAGPGAGVRMGHTTDLRRIREMIRSETPDIIFGSSFENTLSPETPFVSLTYPLKTTAMLHHRPVAGTEGVLSIIEGVLNSLMAVKK